MNKRGLVLSEKFLIIIVLLAGLFGLFVMLDQTGALPSARSETSGITGLAAGEFSTAEEPLDATPVVNQPPVYLGGSLMTQQDVPLAIDLATLFADPESDELTFLATQEDMVGVDIAGTVATFTPAPGFAGERTVTIAVSDGINLLREPVKFVVEGTGAAEPAAPEPVAEEPAPVEQPTLVEEPVAEEPAPEAPPAEPQSNFSTGFTTMDVVNSCPATVNTSTVLTQSLTAAGTCLAIAGDNLVLDCAGFNITFGTGGGSANGIVARNRTNVTITGCLIRDSNAAGVAGIGVNFTNTTNSSLLNTTIFTNGTTDNYGVLIQLGSRNITVANTTIFTRGTGANNYGVLLATNISNVLIENSTITTNGTTGNYGAYFIAFAQNNSLLNTTITTDGSTGSNYGVRIENAANRNIVANSTITTQRPGQGSNFGIYLVTGVSQNLLDGNSIRASGSSSIQGIRLETGAQNNTVSNNYVAALGSSSSNFGIYLVTNAHNNTIIGNAVNASGTTSVQGIRFESVVNNNTVANNVVRTNGSGGGNYGIYLVTTALNNSVVNNTISTNGTVNNDGIRLEATANNNMLVNNTILASGSSNGHRGILLFNTALNNQIINNSIVTNGTDTNYGILMTTITDNNTLILNTISTVGADSYGIRFDSIQGITLMNNTVVTPTDGLFIEGTEFIHFTTHNITTDNTINGSLVQYYGGAGQSPACPDNSVLSAPTARHFAFINCVNVTLENYDAYDVVTLVNAKNMTVTGSRFRDNKYGIRVLDGTGLLIANNNVSANTSTFTDNYGIYFSKTAQNSTIRGNNVTTLGVGANNYAIYLDGNSSNNTIADGFVQTGGTTNNHGIRIEDGSNNVTVMNMTVRTGGTSNNYGIVVFASVSGAWIENTTIRSNGTSASNYGVYLLTFAQNSTLINNSIVADGSAGNNYGVRIESASNRNVVANNSIVTQRPGTATNIGIYLITGVSLNRIDNNTIRASGSSAIQGIRLESGAQNSTVVGNDVATLGSASSNFGIYLVTSAHNNTVIGNMVNASGTSGTQGIRLENAANNNTVANNIVRTNGSSSSNYGIYLVTTALNNSIVNNTVSANGTLDNDGIRLESTANNNMIVNNTVFADGSSNNNQGIALFNSVSGNQVINNTIRTNGTSINYGIFLITVADNNTLILNNISTVGADSYGVRIEDSQGVSMMNNSIETAYDGLFIESSVLIHFNTHNITADNLVNGSSIQYYGGRGQSPPCPNNTILSSPNAAHIDFIGCGNITLTGYNAFDVVTLVGANNITINHSQSMDNKYGFRLLFGAGGNTIANNNISANTTTFTDNYGILLATLVHNNTIAFNNITTMGVGANNFGIWLFNASNNTVFSNGINTSGTSNNNGIRIEGRANNNTVVNNTVNAKGTSSANYGVVLFSSVSDNSVINNTITTNGTTANYGIYLITFAQNSTVAGNVVVAEGTSGSNNGIRLESASNANMIANNDVTVGPQGTANNFGIQAVTGIAWNTITGNSVLARGSSGIHGIILQSGAQNSTVAHNIVTSAGSSSGSRGIYLLTTLRNVTLLNNTVNVSGTSTIIGISVESTANNISVINNTVRVNASSSTVRGILLDTTVLNSNFTGNTFVVNGTTGVNGIRLDTTVNNNLFDNNNISVSGTSGYGIEFVSAAGNQFNRTVLTDPVQWLQSGTASTNNFTNTTFAVQGNGSIAIYGMFQLNATREIAKRRLNITRNQAFLNSTNLTFLNQSAEIALFQIAAGDPDPAVDFEDDGTYEVCTACTELSYAGNVFVFNTTGFTSYSWTEGGVNMTLEKTDDPDPVAVGTNLDYQVSFIVSSGNANNATLTDTYPNEVIFISAQPAPLAGTNNTFILGNLTSGMTFAVNITVFVPVSAANVTLNNTANVSFQNDTGSVIVLNVTESTQTRILPAIAQVILNATNPLTNDTLQNLTLFIINASHAANFTVRNITDFRANGRSIAVVNMPFETNTTGNVSAGAIKDYGTFGSHGTPGGGSASAAPNWTSPGVLGGALAFDGNNDYVIRQPMNSWPSSEITVAFWMNSTNAEDGTPVSYAVTGSTNEFILLNYQNFEIYINGITTGATGVAANNGLFQHIAVTWNSASGNLRIYQNGTLAFNTTHQTGNPMANGGAFVLGQEQDSVGGSFSAAQAFDGVMDELYIFNRTLTPEQVALLYNETASGMPLSVIVSQETSTGDVWQACVTPNDNQTDGNTVCSNNVTISAGFPPVITQVILNTTNPATNDTNQNLTAFIINVSDSDGDVVQNITDWRVNGVSIAAVNMPFDNATASLTAEAVRDYSRLGNNGTLGDGTASQAPIWNRSGQVGGAYFFDGVNDVIRDSTPVGLNFSTTNEFTAMAWINFTASGFDFWLTLNNALGAFPYRLGSSSGGNPYWNMGGSGDQTFTGFTFGSSTWYHVAFVGKMNGSTIYTSIYVNGTRIHSQNSGVSLLPNITGNILVGTGENIGTHPFNGYIDELQVYRRALSDEQINLSFQAGLAGRRFTTVDRNETLVGENWTLAVTPNDNQSDGTTVLSNTVTIQEAQAPGNSAPAIAQVILNTTNPATNDTNQNLTAFIINATDSNNDVVQNITDFRVNGTSIAVLNMPFENGTNATTVGAVRDYSVFGNNGTLGNGSAASVPQWRYVGKGGGAYVFDGTGDRVNIADSDSLAPLSNISIEAWVNITDFVNFHPIIAKRVSTALDYQLTIVRDGESDARQVRFNWGGASIQSVSGTTDLAANATHHVVVTFNNTLVRFYLDGVNDGNSTTTVALTDGANVIEIGHDVVSASPGIADFKGAIAAVRVYNRTLSPEQVREHFLAENASRSLTVIHRNETLTGEIWSACVTPNDNQTDGATVCSNNVTIQEAQVDVNNAPSIAQVILNSTNPLTNNTNQNLTAFIINATDADNNVVQNVTDWRRNGTSIAVLNLPFENNTANTSTGYVRDYSLSGNNATLGGGSGSQVPRWVQANLLGGGYLFNGTDDMITVEDAASLKPVNNITIEFWMNLTGQIGTIVGGAPSGHQYILHKPRVIGSGCFEGYTFTKGSTNVVGVTMTGSAGCGDQHSATTTSTVDTGRWYHVAGTFDGQRIRIYLNGTLEASTAHTSALSYAAAPLVIGQTNDFFDGRFNGTISEVRIYNRNLSDEQIRQLFNEGVAGRRPLTIVSQDTVTGDIWQVCATPNDNQTDGTTVCSNNVTIQDAVNDSASPSIAQVILNTTNPSTNDTNQNLTVFVINATDFNNDTVQNVTDFRRNNISIAVLNAPFETSTESVLGAAIRDYSTFANNGTLGGGTVANAPLWNRSGKVGGAYQFDGTDDFIRFNDSASLNITGTQLTLEAWINTPEATSGFDRILVKEVVGNADPFVRYALYRTGSAGTVNFGVSTGGAGTLSAATSNFSIPTNTWIHMVGTYDGALLRLYLNGELNNSAAKTGSIGSTLSPFIVGGNTEVSAEFFNGLVDEVHIYNRTLDAEQVRLNYLGGIANRSVSTIVSNLTETGEVWHACVTPNDNQTDGNTTCSNNVTIQDAQAPGNNAPAIAQVILNTTNPATNDTNQNLTVFVINAIDFNNDTVQNITDWRRNNSSIVFFNLPFETNVSSTTTGAIRDYGVLGNNGTRAGTGGPTWTRQARVGAGFSLDGSDYISVADSPTLNLSTRPWTISLWVNFSSLDTQDALIAHDEGTGTVNKWVFYHDGTNIIFHVNGPTVGSSNPLSAAWTRTVGMWNHLALTRNGSSFTLYLNGTLFATGSSSVDIPDPSAVLAIGWAEDPFFTAGVFDEVQFFNRTLSAEQVREIYRAGNASQRWATLVHNETQTGDVWQVCATPNDNQTDGNTTCSNNVTIQAEPAPTLASCPATINASTTLSQNLSSNVTCVAFGNDNIVLDCAGFNVTLTNGTAFQFPILATRRVNITVKNCNIVVQTNAKAYGIFLNNTNGSFVHGNNITIAGGSSIGVIVHGSQEVIENNTIRLQEGAAAGISNVDDLGLGVNATHSVYRNNVILANVSSGAVGIDAIAPHTNLTFANNIISIAASGYGIELVSGTSGNSTGTHIINNTINVSSNADFNGGIFISRSGLSSIPHIISMENNTIRVTGNGSSKFGIRFHNFGGNVPFGYTNITGNAISVSGAINNYGIRIVEYTNNTISFNTIAATGSGSYAISLEGGAVGFPSANNFTSNYLANPTQWIFQPLLENNTFTNTTFDQVDGSIRIIGTAQAINTTVTKALLNISLNRAFLNSSALPALNKSAQIMLRTIIATNPQPFVDYADNGTIVDCPPGICTVDRYVNNVFVFNVTQFTTYSTTNGVQLSKSDSPDPANVSQNLSYQVAVNVSVVNASNITLTETYPNQVIFLDAQPAPLAGTNNTFIIGNLTENQTFAVNITVFVRNMSNGTVINNTVNITFQNQTGSVFALNVTESTIVLNVTAAVNFVPSIAQVILNSTLPISNDTLQNLTFFPLGVTDGNNDPVQNISDWRLWNGTEFESIAILNFPFETNTTSTAANALRNYVSRSANATLGDGVASQVPTIVQSRLGRAYDFDGVNDVIRQTSSVPYGFNETEEITAMAWINLSAIDAFDFWLTMQNELGGSQYRFGSDGSGLPYWNMGGGGDQNFIGFTFIPNRSYHVAFVGKKNGSTIYTHIYINGTMIHSVSSVATLAGVNSSLIGTGESVGTHPFNGIIDELQVYDRAFSDEQIRHVFEEGVQSRRPQTLVHQETHAREIWQVAVTPNDNQNGSDGATVLSNNITILSNTPSIAQVILNSTLPIANDTLQNLTLSVLNATDAANNSVQNITDWRVNGTSIAAMNFPFDTDESSLAQRAVRDYSTFVRNATLGDGVAIQSPSPEPGKVGFGYRFDGGNDVIRQASGVPYGFNETEEITAMAWINMSAIDAFDYWLTMQNELGGSQYRFGSDTSGFPYWNMGGGGDQNFAGFTFTPLQWYHVAFVGKKNGSTVYTHIYINGTMIHSVSSTAALAGVNSSLIGTGENIGTNPFFGMIDELQVYNRALSDEQIRHVFEEGRQGRRPQTLVHQETHAREIWHAAVTPNDADQDGATVLSNNITILSNAPSIAQVILNSTNPLSNDTLQNLTAFIINASDPANNSVQNITDWRVNGTSIAAMNFPFDTDETSLAQRAVRDYSTFARNATLGDGVAIQSPSPEPGKVGFGYRFDGGNDGIRQTSSVPYKFNESNEMTAMAWINLSAIDAFDYWLTMQNELGGSQYRFGSDTSGFPYWNMGGGGDQNFAGFTFAPLRWYHVAFVGKLNVSDGTINTHVYINGTPIHSVSSVASLAGVNSSLIGTGENFGTGAFLGMVDEVQVYRRALSDEQIRRIYQEGDAGRHWTTLVNNETGNSTEVWGVCVTPNDVDQDGNTTCSNNVTIGEAAAAVQQNATNLTGCAIINSTAFLSQNVSSAGTCITFNANNVTLNCAGFTITYGTGGGNDTMGVNVTGVANATVENCTIRKGSPLGLRTYGVGVFGSPGASIGNNSVITNGTGTNDALHIAETASELIPPGTVTLVNNPSNVNTPFCTNTTGSSACKVCFTVAGVNCAVLGQGGCTDGEGYKTDTLLRFNTTSVTLGGSIQFIGGEHVLCHLNNNEIATIHTRNNCGTFRSANISASVFIVGENNLTCSVTGSGEDEDNGFKLSFFSYSSSGTILVQNTSNIVVRNNSIVADGGADTRGIFIDAPASNVSNNTVVTAGNATNYGIWVLSENNTVANNVVRTVAGNQSHGLLVAAKFTRISGNNVSTSLSSFSHGILLDSTADNGTVANNTVHVTAAGADGFHVLSSTRNMFTNNTVVAATRAALRLENALDNSFNDSFMPVSTVSLFLVEPLGTLNFSQTINITNLTNLSQVISIGTNDTFVNATDSRGQQFNRSGLLSFNSFVAADARAVFDLNDTGGFENCGSPRCTGFSYNRSTGIARYSIASFTSYAVRSIFTCTTLDLDTFNNETNASFVLEGNVTGTATCFTITSENISLNCNGSFIFYDSSGVGGHGIDIQNARNIVIENCTIVDINAGGSAGHGIFLSNANSSRIANTTVQTNGTSFNNAIHARNSYGNLFVNNTFRTRGTSNINYGVFTQTSSNNVLRELNVRPFGTSSNFGVYFNASSNNNTLFNSTVYASGQIVANRGVQADFSNYNNISGNNITTNGTANTIGIGFTAGNFSRIEYNTVITNSNQTGSSSVIRLDSSNIGSQIIGNNLSAFGADPFDRGIEGGGFDGLALENNIIRADGGMNVGASDCNYTRNVVFANATAGSIFGLVGGPRCFIAHNNITMHSNGSGAVGISLTQTNATIANNTIVVNSTSAVGLRLFDVSVTNTSRGAFVENNTIRAQSSLSYALDLLRANFTVFRNNLLNDSTGWMSISNINGTNFTNTTFAMPNGSIQYLGQFTVNGTHDVSRARLNVSFNRAFVNSSNLTFLNTSAQIALFNISLDDPAPIRDLQDRGVFRACPLSVCSEDGYANGIFVFNVTQFTTYAAGEGLNISKGDSPDPVLTGSLLSYTVVVSVFSGNASNVTLTEQYPPQSAFVSAQPSPVSGTNNTFVIGNLTLGDTIEVNITVLALLAENNTVINNTVNASFNNQTGALRTLNVTEGTTVLAVQCPQTLTTTNTLLQNLSSNGSCITIGADNVVFDCDGFHLLGNGSGTGVSAASRANITIRDCIIENFETGIGLTATVRSAFINNTVISTNVTQAMLNVTPPSTAKFDKNETIFIADNKVELSNLTVSGVGGLISQARVSFHLNHTFDGDIEVAIIAPDGTRVNLTSFNGGGANNYGNDCSADANRTIFDQYAATAIGSGSAPFVGTFQPDTTLFALDNKSGAAVNGVWQLSIEDNAGGDTGNLSCWSLYLNISGAETVAVRGIRLQTASNNNTFSNNTATGNLTAALDFSASQNNSVENTVLGTVNTWIVVDSSSPNNTFRNTTFDQPNGSIGVLPTVIAPTVNLSLAQLNVTFNNAFLNSTAHGFLNTTGVITLRGIGFGNPTPTFDFEDDGVFAVCAASADPFCSEFSYGGGVFVYNVSHFTSYSSEEQGGVEIVLAKSDVPDPVNASAQLNYTVVVNVTTGNASNITLTDVYPPQVIFLSAQPSPLAGTNNTFVIGNLTNGTAVAVNITVLVLNVSNGTVINNTANITFQNQTGSVLNQSVTEDTTVLAAVVVQFNLSNVSIVKLDSPDPVNASGNLSYTIVINATADSPANVTLTDIYPNEVIFLSSQPLPITGTNNTFVVGNMTNGTSFSVNITVLVRNLANGTVINNTANITFQNQTGAAVALSAAQGTVVLNPRLINASIINSTVNNSNLTNCVVINSTVLNSVKSNCTIINSIVVDSNNTNATIIDSTENNSTDTNANVMNSTIIDSSKLNSNLNNSNVTDSNITNTTLINSTVINSNVTNSNLTNCTVTNSTVIGANNVSCTFTNFQPPAAVQFNLSNISVSKSDSPDPVENGTQLNYTITVTSNGNGTAYNVTLTETYPSQVVFNTAQPSPSSGNSTFILGNLTNGTVVAVNITVNVTQVANGTVINNSVNVTFQNETSGLLSAVDTEGTTVNNVTNVSAPAPAPSPGQGGGSGGGGAGGVRRQTEQPVDIISEVCREQWVCGGWTACANNVQSRDCADLRACNTTYAQPALERACVPEAPEAEQPLVLLQPLEPFIALFKANLWLLVFVVLGVVFLTMASWQVGQYRGDRHYRPSQMPLRLPEHDHALRPAGKPHEKKHFYKSLDRLDRQLADLDKGKVPVRVKDRLKPAELPRPEPQARPIPKPVAAKPAVQLRPVIVPEAPRRPGIFERLSQRIGRKVERLDRERTRELSEPHAKKLPVPKPVALKPLRLPSGAVRANDSKEFYHGLDALDRQLGRLEHRKISIKPVKPQRVEPVLLPKPQKAVPPPVVKPARARPDAFERKLREAMRARIDAGVPKASIPQPVVVPKTGGLYDRIMKRMQKITAEPEPRAENAKHAPAQKIQQPKRVRLPSLQDIRRKALNARVKKSEDREDFRKKLRSFDDELERLDKKMKKKAK